MGSREEVSWPSIQTTKFKSLCPIIALIAVLGAALISNWEKIAAKPTFEDGMALLELMEIEQALDVFRPLARSGDAKAQMAMGKLYFTFQITDAYLYRAEYWFQKAKEQGVKGAATMLKDVEAKILAHEESTKKAGTWDPWEKGLMRSYVKAEESAFLD